MDREVRILVAEDSADDAELITRELREGGFAHTTVWVKSKEEFLEAFQKSVPDVVLCDYKMPSFSAPEAMKIIKERYPLLPFIVVSGTMGEDAAIETLTAGATDYVLKSNINKLNPAVKRALEGVEIVSSRKEAEDAASREKERAQRYFDTAAIIMLVLDTDGTVSQINGKGCDILEYEEREIKGKNWFDNFIPERFRGKAKSIFHRILSGEEGLLAYDEDYVVTKDGRERLIGWNNTIVSDSAGKIISVLSSGEDITEAKRLEEESEKRLKELEIFYKASVGREARILELKKEIERLKTALDEKK